MLPYLCLCYGTPKLQELIADMFQNMRLALLNYWPHLFVSAICLMGLFSPEGGIDAARAWTLGFMTNFNWLVMLACTAFLVLCFYLAMSRFGHIKLGKDDEEPEYSMVSWLAMLFAAGMGVGLIFWGTAEPLFHFQQPPPNAAYESASIDAVRHAMKLSHLHWALHPWGIYCLSALAIAYFCFRKDMPLLPSAPMRAQKGWATHSIVCSCVDGLALISVVFGVLASLGFGVLQLYGNLSELVPLPGTKFGGYIAILVVLSICFLASAATGISKGIKVLSDFNMGLCIVFMFFVLTFGPTLFILETFVTSLGDYLSELSKLSFNLRHYSHSEEWTESWTVTYFLWWVAWGPFVGAFIARISRGRTIREFVLGVVLVPSAFCILWFSVLGGAALYLQMNGLEDYASRAIANPELATGILLNQLPLAMMTKTLAVVLMFVFLITSADSGSYVMGMFSTGGNSQPPKPQRIIWGALIAVLTGVALNSGQETMFMKTLSATGAGFFLFVLIWQAYYLVRAVRQEHVVMHKVITTTPKKD